MLPLATTEMELSTRSGDAPLNPTVKSATAVTPLKRLNLRAEAGDIAAAKVILRLGMRISRHATAGV